MQSSVELVIQIYPWFALNFPLVCFSIIFYSEPNSFEKKGLLNLYQGQN